MELVEKNLKDIKVYEKNPRMNDDAVDSVAQSIEEYGFKVPIILDSDNVIVCGHTRYKAAKQLGLKTVPCIIADDLSEDQIKGFRIADNKTSDMSIWDNKLLLDELEALPDDIFTGFDLGDLFDELNENDGEAIDDNEYGLAYEITLRSENEDYIEQVKKYWEELTSEDGHSSSGNIRETSGGGRTKGRLRSYKYHSTRLLFQIIQRDMKQTGKL